MPILVALWATLRFFTRFIRIAWPKPEFRGLLTITLSVIAFGAWFYHRFEPTITTWTDAFYFTVITLTTVGYVHRVGQNATNGLSMTRAKDVTTTS